MAAEIMPDYVRPFVKTHPSDSPSQVASPFKGYTSWWLCGRACTRPRRDTVICSTHGTIDADPNAARNIATRAGLGSGQAPAA
jgi:REP element-mobilizing transposase RayT